MGKKLPNTPRSRVRSALRQLFLRSRERAAAMKAAGNTCQCGAKQSRRTGAEVYVEVHHSHGIGNWDKVIDAIMAELLCSPDRLVVMCKDCHGKQHKGEVITMAGKKKGKGGGKGC